MADILAVTVDNFGGNRLLIAGIISIVLGVLILIAPRLLNYIVAAYLILIGILWVLSAV
jgi:uncharacterized membrane protein HdeD (DUF308 family)